MLMRELVKGPREGRGVDSFVFRDIVFGAVARQQAPPLIRQVGQAAVRPQPQGNLSAAPRKAQYPITL